MKPENFSLKFQNSLAETRITPGSQHGTLSRANVAKATPNGQRAIRKPTKAELKRAGGGKKQARKGDTTNKGGLLRQKVEERLEEKRREEVYADKRREEKEREERARVGIKSILKVKG